MATNARRKVLVASAVIGVGLGGFFDGILLHQVLQWHHLLSLVPGETWRNLGNQILADGLFHVLMYGVTAAGLFLLWRARAGLADRGVSWRTVAGGGLLGFGVWNVIDVAGFHWLMGIHRIRVDVPDPMTYDIGWLLIFGAIPLAISWWLLRRDRGGGEGSTGKAAAMLSLAAVIAAPWASLPPPNSNTAVVFFQPGTASTASFQAARAAGTPVIWMNAEGTMMAVDLGAEGSRAVLYRAGALLVTQSPALAGCAAALKA